MNESLLEYLEDFLLEPSDNAKVVDDPTSSDLKSELKRIENQRSKYQRAWASDHITDDEFAARMDESRVRLEELHELLKEENVVVKEEDVLLHKEIAKNLSANFGALTPKERRDFIQSFVEGVKVSVLEKPKGKGYRNQRIKVDTVRFF